VQVRNSRKKNSVTAQGRDVTTQYLRHWLLRHTTSFEVFFLAPYYYVICRAVSDKNCDSNSVILHYCPLCKVRRYLKLSSGGHHLCTIFARCSVYLSDPAVFFRSYLINGVILGEVCTWHKTRILIVLETSIRNFFFNCGKNSAWRNVLRSLCNVPDIFVRF